MRHEVAWRVLGYGHIVVIPECGALRLIPGPGIGGKEVGHIYCNRGDEGRIHSCREDCRLLNSQAFQTVAGHWAQFQF